MCGIIAPMEKNETEQTNESEVFPEAETLKQESSFWGEVFRFAIIATLIVLPIRLYIAQPFIVSGASMVPTFESGDYLIVDEVSYRFEKPERGDVIVFRFPEDPSTFFIKRIIGLPGEKIAMKGGKVQVTGRDDSVQTLDETYLEDYPNGDFDTVLLGYDEYFVMGDNRNASADSRIWGALPKKLIVGRALVRLFPLSDIELYPGAIQ